MRVKKLHPYEFKNGGYQASYTAYLIENNLFTFFDLSPEVKEQARKNYAYHGWSKHLSLYIEERKKQSLDTRINKGNRNGSLSIRALLKTVVCSKKILNDDRYMMASCYQNLVEFTEDGRYVFCNKIFPHI